MTTTTIFTPQQLAILDKARIPGHVAIIPDGNRRWAKLQSESYDQGHKVGANILIETIKAAKQIGIRALTFYLFSTENWSRSQEEVAALMWLLQEFLREYCEEMQAQGVRLKTIGNIAALPKEVLAVVLETIERTAHCDKIDMVLALNYGSRDEIRRAVQEIIDDCQAGKLPSNTVTEAIIANHLDTSLWGDPDLLIRTSGEMRLSNFLLWQLSYTELYVTEVFWPDFTPSHLLEAIADFQKRERRLGGP